jgi:hypothetical protein
LAFLVVTQRSEIDGIQAWSAGIKTTALVKAGAEHASWVLAGVMAVKARILWAAI